MQTIKLDKLIKLFDSPGIVISKDTNPAGLVLRNCVRVSDIHRIFDIALIRSFRLKLSRIQFQQLNCYLIDAVKNK